MIRFIAVTVTVLAMSLSFTTAPRAQNSPGVQALEAQIKEAERAGITGPAMDQLRDMLEALKQEEAASSSANANRPQMRPNHFDAMNKTGYGDCSQYDDTQAYSFCVSARNAFQGYLKAFSQDAAEAQLATYYDAHVMSARNLVTYVDGGSAPKARAARGENSRQNSQTKKKPIQNDQNRARVNEPAVDTARETEVPSKDASTNQGASSSLFDKIEPGAYGIDDATTSAKVYERQPDTFTGEKAWYSKRDRAIFYARLQAVNNISQSCRQRGAKVDRPATARVRSGDAPPRWTFSVPDCVQGGWKDEEWKCRATVAGHCYWQ